MLTPRQYWSMYDATAKAIAKDLRVSVDSLNRRVAAMHGPLEPHQRLKAVRDAIYRQLTR